MSTLPFPRDLKTTDPNEALCSHVPGVFPHALRLPFVEGLPSDEKIKKLRAWLNKNSDLYKNESVVLYHATDIRVPIASQGVASSCKKHSQT